MDLDALAPYPRTEQDVTADGMARWLALNAYARYRQEVVPAREDWENAGRPNNYLSDALRAATYTFTAEYALAYLLSEIPWSKADDLARKVWRTYDSDDGLIVKALEQWLVDDDIDLDVLRKALDAEAQQ